MNKKQVVRNLDLCLDDLMDVITTLEQCKKHCFDKSIVSLKCCYNDLFDYWYANRHLLDDKQRFLK